MRKELLVAALVKILNLIRAKSCQRIQWTRPDPWMVQGLKSLNSKETRVKSALSLTAKPWIKCLEKIKT